MVGYDVSFKYVYNFIGFKKQKKIPRCFLDVPIDPVLCPERTSSSMHIRSHPYQSPYAHGGGNDRPLSVVHLCFANDHIRLLITRLEVYSEFFSPTRIRTVYLTDG